MGKSKIEWCTDSWNPIVARRRDTGKVGFHCEHASEGCRNCYAETFNLRGLPSRGTRLPYKPAHRADVEILVDARTLLQPLRWRRPRKIFVGSMSDLFADFVDDAMLDQVFAVMALCPQHTFQPLTKRPERMRAYVSRLCNRDDLVADAAVGIVQAVGRAPPPLLRRSIMTAVRGPLPLPNVWLGTSCEDQATADARLPHLLATPAAIRFVSAEPLLGPLRLMHLGLDRGTHGFPYTGDARGGLDQVILGGESGPKARPMHPAWARAIRDQCAAAGVSFFFKQWGEWGQNPLGGGRPLQLDGRFAGGDRSFGDVCDDETIAWMHRWGKKAAGRLLDGVTHDAMPAPEVVPV